MAAPCLHASGARQGVPRLTLRVQNKHIRCSAAKAAVKSNFDAHSRMVGCCPAPGHYTRLPGLGKLEVTFYAG